MKTRDFDAVSASAARPRNGRRLEKRMGFGAALLGIVCVAGVFGVLALLYNLGQ